MGGAQSPGHLVIQEWNKDHSQLGTNRCYVLIGRPADYPIQNITVSPGTKFPLDPPRDVLDHFLLTVYHVNDLHGQIVQLHPEGELPVLSRLAGELQKKRSAIQDQPDQGILVLSAGDDCAGSIFDELGYTANHKLPTHPCYHLYSKIGVDLVGLGNHDFDQGLDWLIESIQQYASFPVLAANLSYDPNLPQVIYPGAILLVNRLRVGVIGLVTRAETRLQSDQATIVNPLPVAHNLVEAIQPFCDLVIVVSHLGYCLESSKIPMADVGDIQLAASLPSGSVDLLVGGHSHTALNAGGFDPSNLVQGVPIVQAGQGGDFIGRAAIEIQAGKAKITQAELVSPADLAEDQEFYQQEIEPFVAWARNLMEREIGRIDPLLQITAEEVRSYFAVGELGLANFICDALYDRLLLLGHEIDFTMLDLSAVQCGFPHRDLISFGDCFELMPYTDTVRLYQLTGSQLIQLIQDNVRRMGSESDPAEDRGFMQFSRQIRYTVQVDNQANTRVAIGITFQHKPLEDYLDRTFWTGTTCFTRVLAASWEQMVTPEALLLASYPYQDTDILLRHELISFIRDWGDQRKEGDGILDGRIKIKQI